MHKTEAIYIVTRGMAMLQTLVYSWEMHLRKNRHSDTDKEVVVAYLVNHL
jgi:hypothetical protein